MTSPRVRSLHRYPVKSMLGEDVEELVLTARGCSGDRVWSVRTANGKIGSGKTTRRFTAVPGLLELRAVEREGEVVVVFPDGSHSPAAAPETAERISRHVGQPVTLASETDVSHFDDGPVSLLGSASAAAVAHERGEPVALARFRPNIVLDIAAPFAEDGWVGRQLRIGSATLAVTMVSPRCVMVDLPTADLPAQHGNLLAVGRLNDACLGVIATVVTAGAVGLADSVELD